MADIYLKLDGVTGESKDQSHPDEIEVLSVSFGMHNSGSFGQGTGGGTGKVSIQDLVLTKYVDKASPTLMIKCAKGDHIDTGKLTVRKAGTGQQDFYIIDLEKIVVSSVTNGGSNGGGDRLTENISLNFNKVTINYAPQKDDGSLDTKIEFSWDAELGVAS